MTDKNDLLRKIFGFLHGSQRLARHAARPYQLRGQHRVLHVLAKEGTLIQSQLAEILDIRPSSLTELLSKLEDRGLISRTPDENDKRVTNVTLTDAGKKAIENESGTSDKLTDDIFAGLSDEEIEQLNNLFDKLNRSLKEKLPARDERPDGFPGHHHHHGFGGPSFGGHHGGPRGYGFGRPRLF
ncbi:MarR family winged helix-turn-helix transcriptional regulator [Lentilactobacillus farraginis]|uniref:Transcriptional regulator n=1 Tax=Lentilactobacillus farraginis DSM 18382 = JCM 14108 TaxID=1423743 RepID=X0QAC6_9LACO|nr:MarR family transcriptional regulator [Lentilactobacillus farraginis]KRM11023.1 transcriptional regulator [Lentilactobacillus farraginis DSM 18382 = JCM 14108]GAF35550.1 transcriptional regulator [Lentilactobacillus farraginis DSM 18382 = JCM 14108]